MQVWMGVEWSTIAPVDLELLVAEVGVDVYLGVEGDLGRALRLCLV